ncbi:MAG TPA: glycerophosphodiester phosphodiesterase family protein [Rhodothermales bacterium]
MTPVEMVSPVAPVEPPRFDVQGHRGARGFMPENTIAGFVRALELGVQTLEMDVVISRDGQVVLSHDPWFSSDFSAVPSGRRIRRHEQFAHRIFEMDYERICTYDCGRQNRRFPRQVAGKSSKPRLADVLRTAEAFVREHGLDPVFYNIETKTSPAGDEILHPAPAAFVGRLLTVVEDAGVLDRTIIQSFDPRTLRIVRMRRVPARTSLLVARGDHLGVDADLEILGFVPDVYSPDFRLVTTEMVQDVHARGMRLIPWTVNQTADMRRMADIGTDGFITDYPDTARVVL